MQSRLTTVHAGRRMVLVLLCSVACLLSFQVWSVGTTPLTSTPVQGRVVVELDHEKYAPFLLEPWREGRQTIIVAMDPNCSYCIKSLDKLDLLRPFNTYLIWTPILGPRSAAKVDAFFQCENPIGSSVLQAMKARQLPVCKDGNPELLALNKAAQAVVKPNAVPSYYLEGRRVSFSRLYNLTVRGQGDPFLPGVAGTGFGTSRAGKVAVDWPRYDNFLHTRLAGNHQTASVVLDPDDPSTTTIIEKIAADTRFHWYVFWLANSDGAVLEKMFSCESEKERQIGAAKSTGQLVCSQDTAALLERNEEFQLLMGVETAPAAFLDGRPVAFKSLLN